MTGGIAIRAGTARSGIARAAKTSPATGNESSAEFFARVLPTLRRMRTMLSSGMLSLCRIEDESQACKWSGVPIRASMSPIDWRACAPVFSASWTRILSRVASVWSRTRARQLFRAQLTMTLSPDAHPRKSNAVGSTRTTSFPSSPTSASVERSASGGAPIAHSAVWRTQSRRRANRVRRAPPRGCNATYSGTGCSAVFVMEAMVLNAYATRAVPSRT